MSAAWAAHLHPSVRLDSLHAVGAFAAFQTLSLVLLGGWVSLLAYPLYVLALWALSAFSPLRPFTGQRLPVGPARSHAVLVTGCSSGIGRAAALQLAADGFLVLATVRKAEDAKRLAADAPHNAVKALIVDVTDERSVAAARDATEKELSRRKASLVGVVNNAGYSESAPFELVPLEALRRQLDTNVVGQVAVSQAFLPLLRRGAAATGRSARLVFVSSVVGRFTAPLAGPYCASKYALESVVDAFRMELAPWDVDVVAIQPGAIGTSFAETFLTTLERNTGADGASDPAAAAVVATYQKGIAHTVAARAKRKSGGVEHTTEAIIGALLDERPLTRYVAGADARFMVPLLLALPDRLRDRVVGKAFNVAAVNPE